MLKSPPARRLPAILLVALLAGCATSESGRRQVVAPDVLGAAYSGVDMHARVALASDRDCVRSGCPDLERFRRQIVQIGQELADAAYAEYPGLDSRVPRFEFVVPDKDQIGTLSSAGGTVVVLAGMAAMEADPQALAFVLAREMGHIIGRHHEENSAMSIIVSVAAQLLLPITNIIRGAAAAIPVTTAATATTTAASMVGSRVLKAVNRPDQLDEADTIALRLLRHAGRDLDAVAQAVGQLMPTLARAGEEGWVTEFRQSTGRLAQLDCGASGLLGGSGLALVAVTGGGLPGAEWQSP